MTEFMSEEPSAPLEISVTIKRAGKPDAFKTIIFDELPSSPEEIGETLGSVFDSLRNMAARTLLEE